MFEQITLYLPTLSIGIGETISLAALSLILGLILGILFTIFETGKVSLLRLAFHCFTTTIRGIPEILLLFAFYFGGSTLLSTLFNKNIDINPFVAGVLTLSLIFGSYSCKILSSALNAISIGEREAAKAIGFSNWQIGLFILWPQMIRHALPGLGNLWLILLKDTALISLIGGSDLMSRTQIIIRNTEQPFTFYLLLSIIYLMLNFISEWATKWFINSKMNSNENKVSVDYV